MFGIRQCSNCGKEIEIYHSKRMKTEYVCCSVKCLSEYRKSKTELNATCCVCGKKFHCNKSQYDSCKNHYCSVECHRIAKMEYMKGEKNHQYGLKGNKNNSWKSDRRISSCGYVLVRDLNHPFRNSDDFVMEHRLVAEKCLFNDENSIEIDGKKYLKKEYVVHHINFDRTDNRVENLIVMQKGEHTELHNKLNPQNRDSNGRYTKGEDMQVKFKKVKDSAKIPTKGTKKSAGFDLYADTQNEITIKPHTSVYFDTNIALEIPDGYFGGIYARSGLSTKKGLRPSTCVSVIDCDFRGSITVPLYNDSENEQVVLPYERIAQLVIQPILDVDLVECEELSDTERGDGGFGSTGKI